MLKNIVIILILCLIENSTQQGKLKVIPGQNPNDLNDMIQNVKRLVDQFLTEDDSKTSEDDILQRIHKGVRLFNIIETIKTVYTGDIASPVFKPNDPFKNVILAVNNELLRYFPGNADVSKIKVNSKPNLLQMDVKNGVDDIFNLYSKSIKT